MQTRLLACLTGGLLGVAVSSMVGSSLGLSTTLALIACPLVGIAAGCVISLLFDAFAFSSGDHETESR
jgi:uncharacterized membrane protein YuzA (DUF378 family)